MESTAEVDELHGQYKNTTVEYSGVLINQLILFRYCRNPVTESGCQPLLLGLGHAVGMILVCSKGLPPGLPVPDG